MKIIKIFILGFIVIVLGCATQGGRGGQSSQGSESSKIPNWLAGAPEGMDPSKLYRASEIKILQPFVILGVRAEYHLIAWFDDHPKYSAVEIFRYPGNKIRAILTRRDDTQIDALNFDISEMMPIRTNRERYTTPIDFVVHNDTNAELKLKTPEGEELVLTYFGQGKPNTRHGGLTNPGRHSPEGGLPVFYRDASSVSDKNSSVRIGGKTYTIPVDEKISVPPFFTAYSAFLSTGYVSFIMPTFSEQSFPLTSATSPSILTQTRNGVTEIQALRPGGDTEIKFNPPLPNLVALNDQTKTTSRFAVFFNNTPTEEVYGTLEISKSGSSVTIRLYPEYPSWAKAERAMIYDVRLMDDKAEVLANMLKK